VEQMAQATKALPGWDFKSLAEVVGVRPLIESIGLRRVIQEIGLQAFLAQLTPEEREEAKQLLAGEGKTEPRT
jgi:hypothetical protein